MKPQVTPELLLKQQTLIAWANILYQCGMIDLTRRLALIRKFEQIALSDAASE